MVSIPKAMKIVDKADEVGKAVSNVTDTIADTWKSLINNSDETFRLAFAGDGYFDDAINVIEATSTGVSNSQKSIGVLNDSDEFIDEALEAAYQKYLLNKSKKGETPKNRLDWEEAKNFWNNNTNVARGNKFNKTAREQKWYEYYEIHLENGKRLDSYDPNAGEIISRKATELDDIAMETYMQYLSEFKNKYAEGTKIRSNQYSAIDGTELKGKYILEIPDTNKNSPNIQKYKDIAAEYGVELRFRGE